jgi:hypothetical protein
VNECFKDGEWINEFIRPFGAEEVAQWEGLGLLEDLSDISLHERSDRFWWCLEKSRIYTTRSMYWALTHRGVINICMRKLKFGNLSCPWNLKCSCVADISWQDANKGGTEEEELERQWELQYMWGARNTRSYFLLLRFIRNCLVFLQEALGWDRVPKNLQDFLGNWLPMGCADYSLKTFLLGWSYGPCGIQETNVQ